MITLVTRADLKVASRNKELEQLESNDFTSPTNTIIGMANLSAVIDGADVKILKNRGGATGMTSRFELDMTINKHIRGEQ